MYGLTLEDYVDRFEDPSDLEALDGPDFSQGKPDLKAMIDRINNLPPIPSPFSMDEDPDHWVFGICRLDHCQLDHPNDMKDIFVAMHSSYCRDEPFLLGPIQIGRASCRERVF